MATGPGRLSRWPGDAAAGRSASGGLRWPRREARLVGWGWAGAETAWPGGGRVAVEAGLGKEREGNSGLAGAGRRDEQDIVGTTYEVEGGKGVDLPLVDSRLAFEREGIERPTPRQMCLIEGVGEAALASRRRLCVEQATEQFGGGRASPSARSISSSRAAAMPWQLNWANRG